MIGSETGWPSTVVDRSTSGTPTSTLGLIVKASKSRALRRRVTSSQAPPST